MTGADRQIVLQTSTAYAIFSAFIYYGDIVIDRNQKAIIPGFNMIVLTKSARWQMLRWTLLRRGQA